MRKIILFIVEGITDKTALSLAMQRIFDQNEIVFKITEGDITTRNSVDTQNVERELCKLVKNVGGKIFKQKDFLEVVHLVDLDGSFISDDKVLSKTGEEPVDPNDPDKPFYTEENIFCKLPEGIIARNQKKSRILRKLITLPCIWVNIPYSVYYFSCNLDHFLHDNANVHKCEKYRLADEFECKYAEIATELISFLEDNEVPKNYRESWDFAMEECNSLKKHNNFFLFFSAPKNERIAN